MNKIKKIVEEAAFISLLALIASIMMLCAIGVMSSLAGHKIAISRDLIVWIMLWGYGCAGFVVFWNWAEKKWFKRK